MTTLWLPYPDVPDLFVSRDGTRRRWAFTCGKDTGFILGTTEATAGNTGCPVDTSQLEANNSNVEITGDKGIIKNQWFKQGITLKGNLNRFQNCYVGENPTALSSGNYVGIQAYNPTYYGNLFERSTIIPTNPQVLDYGLVAANITTHMCKTTSGWTDAYNWQTDTSDGAKQPPGGCVSAGDFLMPTVYPNDPHQKNGLSHSDCIQIANGRQHLVVGSTLHAIVGGGPNDTTSNYQNSHGMVIGPYAKGGIGGVTVISSKFIGGGAQFSALPNSSTDWAPVVPKIVLVNNKFDATGCLNELKGGLWYPQSILMTPETRAAAVLIGNVQVAPCIPMGSGGAAYGAKATPSNPVPVEPFLSKN